MKTWVHMNSYNFCGQGKCRGTALGFKLAFGQMDLPPKLCICTAIYANVTNTTAEGNHLQRQQTTIQANLSSKKASLSTPRWLRDMCEMQKTLPVFPA
jgi:hypothetical protein